MLKIREYGTRLSQLNVYLNDEMITTVYNNEFKLNDKNYEISTPKFTINKFDLKLNGDSVLTARQMNLLFKTYLFNIHSEEFKLRKKLLGRKFEINYHDDIIGEIYPDGLGGSTAIVNIKDENLLDIPIQIFLGYIVKILWRQVGED